MKIPAVSKQNKQLTSLYLMGEQMALGKDLNVLMHNAAYGVYETLNVTCVLLCELCGSGRNMSMRAGIGIARQYIHRTKSIAIPNPSLPGRALAANQPIHMSGRANARWLDGLDCLSAADLEYGVATVLKDSMGHFGLIMAFHGASNNFSAEDIDYIQSLSNLLSVAADRTKIFHRQPFRSETNVAVNQPWNYPMSA